MENLLFSVFVVPPRLCVSVLKGLVFLYLFLAAEQSQIYEINLLAKSLRALATLGATTTEQ